MVSDGFICDDCGFTSIEEVGTGNTYICPKCGNKMRRATHTGVYGGGDANPDTAIIAFDVIYFVVAGSISFGIMNAISYWTSDLVDWLLFFLWLVLFLASLVFIHKGLTNNVKGKAIIANNKDKYCTECGEPVQ